MARNRDLGVSYAHDLRLLKSPQAKLGALLLLALWVLVPLNLSDSWLNILNYAAVAANRAHRLNLLTGFTGQVSIGHAFFLGCGAYVTAWFGVRQELSMITWLPLAAVIGAVVGAVIGPFALRLRGDYLAIITVGLLFVGEHIFENWESVTGGGFGTQSGAPLDVGSIRFNELELLGSSYTRDQGIFWLYWALVAVAALLAKNLVRTRPGRAMQAIRDRDVAAEVIGVSLARYKIGAFAVSSAFAATAGALYGSLQQYIDPEQFGGLRGLFTSIEYIAMIILGGIGTIFGAILGAIVLSTIDFLIADYSHAIPLITWKIGNQPLLTVELLNQIIYGFLIIVFLLVEPRGLAAVWFRLKAYFRTWPFSY